MTTETDFLKKWDDLANKLHSNGGININEKAVILGEISSTLDEIKNHPNAQTILDAIDKKILQPLTLKNGNQS